MSIILWPRQEVLQLVIPELAIVGRVLNVSTAINVIRRLTRYQSTEGKLRYSMWEDGVPVPVLPYHHSKQMQSGA